MRGSSFRNCRSAASAHEIDGDRHRKRAEQKSGQACEHGNGHAEEQRQRTHELEPRQPRRNHGCHTIGQQAVVPYRVLELASVSELRDRRGKKNETQHVTRGERRSSDELL